MPIESYRKELGLVAAAIAVAFIAVALSLAGILFESIGFLLLLFSTMGCGYAAVTLLGFDKGLPLPAKLALWAVAGTVLFTQTVFAISLLVGYGLASAALSLCIWAALFEYCISTNGTGKVRFSIKNVFAELSKDKAAFVFAAFVFVLVTGVLWYSTMRKVDGGYSAGGWNWSDYLVHLSIITSANSGNFLPQTPFLAGSPLQYDWFVDLHAAIVILLSGSQAVAVTSLQSGILAAALALAIYSLAKLLVKNKRAAAFAMMIAVLGGGLGFLRLYDHLSTNKAPLFDLLSKESYDNSWSSDAGVFTIPSVLGTGLFTHRSSLLGLPLFVLVALLLLYKKPSAKEAAMIGGLVVLSVPFRYFSYAAIGVFTIGLIAVSLFGALKKRSRKAEIDFLFSCLPYFLIALLGAAWLFSYFSSGMQSNFKVNLGWEATKDSPASFIWFYTANFGIPLVLAILGFAFAKFDRKLLVALCALLLFLVPNLVSFVAIPWDMNKFFQYSWLLLAIPAGALLAKIPRQIAYALVAASVISPLLCATWFVLSNQFVFSDSQMAQAVWIRDNTPPMSVFATPTFINQPTDFAGRLRILTFTPYASNFGVNPAPREADLNKIYCGTDSESAFALSKYGAKYILDQNVQGPCSYAYRSSPLFSLAFDDAGSRIYKLN